MVKINKGSHTPTTVGIYKLQKWNRGLNSKNMTLKTPPVKQIYAKFVFFWSYKNHRIGDVKNLAHSESIARAIS